ncbi:MAG TPA: GNAT family protein [Nitrosospira sp.]|jgi:ribosomal-protein-serine acetyltransferase|nr:GNAT family protein [Nitrosospira sp.]
MREIRIDDDLTLVELSEGDIDSLAAVVKENLPHIGPWQLWAVPDYGVKQAREFVERNIGAGPGTQSFGIFYEGKLSGCAGYVPRDEKGVAEIGYWISSEHQGKGIVTRCARALIEHAFRYLGADRVEIHAAALNFRSRAVAERLRFDLEERRKNAHPLPNGIIDDLVVYSIHKRNWNF